VTAAELDALWPDTVRPNAGLVIARQPGRGLRRQVVSEWIARLALVGPVHVLDGGNVFDAYRVARLIRAQTHDLEAIMGQIIVRRAFTCYQMAALLANTANRRGERRSPLPHPVVVLELLATFADENVPPRERERLFEQCLADLKRLSRRSPTLVSVTCPANDGPNEFGPNSFGPNSFGFDRLVEAADPELDGESLCLGPGAVQPGLVQLNCVRLPSPRQTIQMSLWTTPGGPQRSSGPHDPPGLKA
jgi:hypothetical protein